MQNLVSLTRLLDRVRVLAGLPDEIEAKLTALDTLTKAARETSADNRAQAEGAAVAALVEAANTGKPLPANVEKQVTEAVHHRAGADTRRELLNRAVEVAQQGLISTASAYADDVTAGRLRPKVDEALECLPDVEKLIPVGLDDAGAFRAPGEVQNAWRTLTDTADVVDQAISIRSAMCNRAGSAISIDHPEPNVFTADWGGGLRYGLVSNPYALDKAGRWPATSLDFRHRLIALHHAGAEFHLATGDEITQLVAADEKQARQDRPGPAMTLRGSVPRQRAMAF